MRAIPVSTLAPFKLAGMSLPPSDYQTDYTELAKRLYAKERLISRVPFPYRRNLCEELRYRQFWVERRESLVADHAPS